MTNLVPEPNWSDVRQLEANEYATGGAGGNMNEQALALTARTGYLDKYTASPYRTGKVYDLNERVQLEIGDIVKSTIADNTANPNVDMTGWVKTNSAGQILLNNGINQKQRNEQAPTILDYFTKSEFDAYELNSAMDVTAIIKRAFAAGVKKLNFLDLQMHITPDVVTGLGVVFNSGDIELYGNGATFVDNTTYPKNEKIAALFTLSGGVNSFKSNINYIGNPVSLSTEIGYVGATYVYSKGVNKNITLDTYLENIRYGILCGDYSDQTLGGTKTIRGRLDCKNVGYPIASYLADDIELKITGDGFHRVHYIAGCTHARIKTQVKNYYIAPIPHFYTDAKTGEGTSKGCYDCETEAIDLGSTSYVSGAFLMGVSLSRVDPSIVFDKVTLSGAIKSTNTQASQLGLYTINSSAKTQQPSYPANWNANIQLNNITIKGIIDRRNQTTAEPVLGEGYLATVDDVSIPGELISPKISNLSINVDYFKGTGTQNRGFWNFIYGLQDEANIRLNAIGSGVNIFKSNTTSLIKFTNSNIVGVDSLNSASLNSKMEFINSNISNPAYLPLTNKKFINTVVAGSSYGGFQIKTVLNLINLTGSSVTWANALPSNALILGISFVITETVTGTSGVQVGITGSPVKFYNVLITEIGSGVSISSAPTGSFPYIATSSQGLIFTARDAATFTSGKLRVEVSYIEIPLPII